MMMSMMIDPHLCNINIFADTQLSIDIILQPIWYFLLSTMVAYYPCEKVPCKFIQIGTLSFWYIFLYNNDDDNENVNYNDKDNDNDDYNDDEDDYDDADDEYDDGDDNDDYTIFDDDDDAGKDDYKAVMWPQTLPNLRRT